MGGELRDIIRLNERIDELLAGGVALGDVITTLTEGNVDLETLATIIAGMKEPLTGGMSVINTDHGFIHEGVAFKAHIPIASLSDSTAFSFKTPVPWYLHFKNLKLGALGGTVKVSIMRGTSDNPLTIDSAGVAVAALVGPNNLNDNSANPSEVEIKETPTYVGGAEGEVWDVIQVVGDATNQFTSVAETASNDNEELVMQPDTYYVFKVEKIGGDTPTNVLLTLFWYNELEGLAE